MTNYPQVYKAGTIGGINSPMDMPKPNPDKDKKEERDRLSIDLSGLRDRIQKCRDNDIAWSETNFTQKVRTVIKKGLEQFEKEKGSHVNEADLLKSVFKTLMETGGFDGFSVAEIADILKQDPSEFDDLVSKLDRLADCLSALAKEDQVKQPKRSKP